MRSRRTSAAAASGVGAAVAVLRARGPLSPRPRMGVPTLAQSPTACEKGPDLAVSWLSKKNLSPTTASLSSRLWRDGCLSVRKLSTDLSSRVDTQQPPTLTRSSIHFTCSPAEVRYGNSRPTTTDHTQAGRCPATSVKPAHQRCRGPRHQDPRQRVLDA